MEKTPWQQRAKAAGLKQKLLARLLGLYEITVSRQLRGRWQSGTPKATIAAILAWEIMSPEQREQWIEQVERETAAPDPSVEQPAEAGRGTFLSKWERVIKGTAA